MGAAASRLPNPFLQRSAPTYIMLGLGGAGKTAILYRLKLGELVTLYPTFSDNIETIEYKYKNKDKDGNKTTDKYTKRPFDLWDISEGHGRRQLRDFEMWETHYRHLFRGVIFVVDSADQDNLSTTLACEQFEAVLWEECSSQKKPLLILANKQDVPHAMTVADVRDLLGLERLPEEQVWHIQSVSAKTGEGLNDGFDWLLDHTQPLVR
ncbi:hypothetical protein BGX23_004984 [Mortierella sp. AD031]|nr:hypothetical protein BGX23_004984 [Mortierella sp. AD031]KAG0217604.1 hypothetical protein BGX33_010121 [Mortierella sp. NVP41]